MVGRRLIAATILIAGVAVISTRADAAASTFAVDQMLAQFQAKTSGWGAALKSLALHSFYLLALMDLALCLARNALGNGDARGTAEALVWEVMRIGIFLVLMLNAVVWNGAIIQSFRAGAQAVGATGVTPGGIFASGVTIAQQVLAASSWFTPMADVGLWIAAIVILLAFVGLAFLMTAVIVESYMVIQAGVLLMAFGGIRFTQDMALSVYKYAVAVGAKLMIISLIASIGQGFITDWTSSFNNSNATPILVVLGCSVILFALAKIVPDTFMRLVGGASLASGAPIMTTAAMTVGAVAAVGAAGGGALLAGARAAGAGVAAGARTGGAGAAASATPFARMAAGMRAAGAAIKTDKGVSGALSGGARAGRSAWRISQIAADKVKGG